MTQRHTIALIDDHVIVREGIAELLRQAGMDIVGQASTGEAGLEIIAQYKPSLLLLDVALLGCSSAQICQTVVQHHAPTKVLALSSHSDPSHVLSMIESGASGYVLKTNAFEELIHAIEEVMNGKRHFDLDILKQMPIGQLVNHGRPRSLTAREIEVLSLIAAGKPMKAAALELHISTKTVETHRRAIMEKLGLFSVAELTKHAIRNGLTFLD